MKYLIDYMARFEVEAESPDEAMEKFDAVMLEFDESEAGLSPVDVTVSDPQPASA